MNKLNWKIATWAGYWLTIFYYEFMSDGSLRSGLFCMLAGIGWGFFLLVLQLLSLFAAELRKPEAERWKPRD